ncbi:AraC family transcriptional regulator [Sphingobacterium multivorum]|uniref:helix-turn-helix transcriptional regulator n=1 Tax=Sphingobacterium multivorum TaxID=28454 RepID=UPI002FDA4B8F
MTPEDSHTFEIPIPTKVCIIDFTKGFFLKNIRIDESQIHITEIYKQLEYIFHNHHAIKGNLISKDESAIFKALVHQLLKEKNRSQFFDDIIVQDIIYLLLHLIARKIQESISLFSKIDNPKSKVHEITTYIQQHIYDNELLKIKMIASDFGKSPDHLNRYFKKETGSTIKAYIIQYKLHLVQTRLKFSDLTISEIANELNFTDESHLNKIFKKSFGKTAKQYRT